MKHFTLILLALSMLTSCYTEDDFDELADDYCLRLETCSRLEVDLSACRDNSRKQYEELEKRGYCTANEIGQTFSCLANVSECENATATLGCIANNMSEKCYDKSFGADL